MPSFCLSQEVLEVDRRIFSQCSATLHIRLVISQFVDFLEGRRIHYPVEYILQDRLLALLLWQLRIAGTPTFLTRFLKPWICEAKAGAVEKSAHSTVGFGSMTTLWPCI